HGSPRCCARTPRCRWRTPPPRRSPRARRAPPRARWPSPPLRRRRRGFAFLAPVTRMSEAISGTSALRDFRADSWPLQCQRQQSLVIRLVSADRERRRSEQMADTGREGRFSELIRRAINDGPQTVTHRGADIAVVLSIEDYRRLTGAKRSFL